MSARAGPAEGTEPTAGASAVPFPLLFGVWILAGTAALFLKRTQLFISVDGRFVRQIAERQFEFRIPVLSTSLDFMQGVGDVFYGNVFRLMPAFIAGSLVPDDTGSALVTYAVILAELSAAIIWFGRSLGLPRSTALAAAVATCLLIFPFFGSGLIVIIVALVPQVGTFMAVSLAAAGAFFRVGRGGTASNLLLCAVALSSVLWSVLASVQSFLLSGPMLFICAVAGIIAAGDWRERWWKIALVAVAAATLAAGPMVYLLGLVLNSAASVFPQELVNDRANFYFASILFQWSTVGPAGPILVVLALLGAMRATLRRDKPALRFLGFTLLTYFVTRMTFSILVILFDFWRGPSPIYFEYFVLPIYAIFAAFLLSEVAARLRRPDTKAAPYLETGLVAAAATIAVLAAHLSISPHYPFGPPRSTPIVEVLAREIALRPGDPFRGRSATYTGLTLDRSLSWPDLHNLDGALSEEIGNDMRITGMAGFRIPTLFQYGPTMTPAFYAFTSRLLALPRDRQMRNTSALRRIDPKILALLGARFVIADAEQGDPLRFRGRQTLAQGGLFLYELDNPNLGDYSPTAVVPVVDASSALARMGGRDFDPRREVIADRPDLGALTPATGARLIFEGASLSISAESTGRSILVLPLEFSRCLALTAIGGGNPELFRADLLLTGIAFLGRLDARIALRTGPYLRPDCRLRDRVDLSAMGIGSIPAMVTAR